MPEQKPVAPVKPPRSPIERAIVWGVIGIGLLMIGVEATAHFAHGAALGKLRTQFDETLNKDRGMTKKDVDQVVGNKIPETQMLGLLDTAITAARVDIYSYPGLLRSRKLYVYYGVEGKTVQPEAEVMEVTSTILPTAAEADAKRPPIDPENSFASPADSLPGAGGPGGPGSTMGGGTGNGAGPRRENGKDAGGRPQTEAAAPTTEEKPGDTAANPAAEAQPGDPEPKTE